MKLFIRLTIGAFLLLPYQATAQSLRGITGIAGMSNDNLRLPSQTIIGVSMETTKDLGLVETTSTLQRQRIEVKSSPGISSVIDVYAGADVESVKIFDPSTFSNSTVNTGVDEIQAKYRASNCGAFSQTGSITGTGALIYAFPIVSNSGDTGASGDQQGNSVLPAQNPLGGQYWLGGAADTTVSSNLDRSVSAGTGLGNPSYSCP